VRIESVIAIDAADTVGPTRLRLLTAASSRLPVVVVARTGEAPSYHVFDVATLQAAMTSHLSATPLRDALDLATTAAPGPVSKHDAKAAPAGSPVVENGRLIGVVADDLPEIKEFTEADMARGDATSDTKRRRPKWLGGKD